MEHGVQPVLTKEDLRSIFPEIFESEDERIRKEIIEYIKGRKITPNHPIADEWISWLEKQAPKPKWSEEDESKVEDVIYFLDTAKVHYASTKALDDCIDWLKSLKQRIHDNFEKTCKDDTLLDLLQKMPSYITVDGIDYHFVMKKTSIYIAYYAYYKGNGEEGRGNAIFGITAHSPIDLLTEMLEILKEKGLL